MKESSKHFTLQKLAEGVYAAIANLEGGEAICNAGLIDLGEYIVLFDTFLTPQAARDLLGACLDLFGRKPSLIVNSHYHNDHTWGNQVFLPEARIIATTRMRELFLTDGREEVEWNHGNAARMLDTYQEKYRNAVDDRQRREAALWIGEYGGIVEALPTLEVCPPSMTFDGRLELHGSKAKAELLPFDNTHTKSDMVLFLPEEKILFMSDLLFVDCHPFLGDGDATGLLHALQELSGLGATCFVPGHGPLGTAKDLQLMIEYINDCQETARQLVSGGSGWEERIKNIHVPGKYGYWLVSTFYPANIRFLCQGMADGK